MAVSSVAIPATLRALRLSMRHIRFGATKFLTDKFPESTDDMIDWIAIPAISSRADYSRFMLRALHHHVATSHALVVQWDGHVSVPDAWTDAFLAYDYIGAPWPQFDDGLTVGNGGFSLRSARLLAASALLPDNGDVAEDLIIGRHCRKSLESDHGIRFASEAVARAFAFERTRPRGNEFGFHGIFNMAAMLDHEAFQTLYEGIEPGLVGFREQRDLIQLALERRSAPLLRTVLGLHARHTNLLAGLKLFSAGAGAYLRAHRPSC